MQKLSKQPNKTSALKFDYIHFLKRTSYSICWRCEENRSSKCINYFYIAL